MVHCASSFSSPAGAQPRAPRFEIHADGCPQVLPRVLGLFARLDLLPVDVRARRSCGVLWAALHVDIDPAGAERAAEKLRAIIGVDAVVLVHAPAEARPIERRLAA